jgi:hypothetical protein
MRQRPTRLGLVGHALTFPWRYTRRQIARWQRGQIYGASQPAWWPARLVEWPGMRSPHAGKSVVIFEGGRRYEFAPAVWGPYRGHVYHGTFRPDAADIAGRLIRLGLPAAAAPILAIVSGFEGGYDSIQTFDRGKFSWGFIQFTANGGLPRLLNEIKRDVPEVFEQCFAVDGVDARDGALILRENGRDIRGRRVADRLHDEPRLWMAFVRASQREEVRDAQVRAAYDSYYAHPLTVTVVLGGHEVALGDLYAGDPFGRAFICDRAVNHGIGHLRLLLRKSIRYARATSVADAGAILAAARAFEAEDGDRIAALEERLRDAGV